LIIGKNKVFDKILENGSGRLLGIEIHPTPNHNASTADTFDINVFHYIFGHTNSQVVAATAAKYGFKTENTLHVCSNCAINKDKQLTKLNLHPSSKPGGRIISSVQYTSYGGANCLPLAQYYFIKTKSD
jgi:hypothetical protein